MPCWSSKHGTDPLFLQVREAEPSVVAEFTGASRYANQGQRVVAGQRLMQAARDIFLGWQRTEKALDGLTHDFYVRQLRDWKFSVDVEAMRPMRSRSAPRTEARDAAKDRPGPPPRAAQAGRPAISARSPCQVFSSSALPAWGARNRLTSAAMSLMSQRMR